MAFTIFRRYKLPYGLTYQTQHKLSSQLSAILNIPAEDISKAMDEITRAEVMRIAANEVEG